MGEYLIYKPTLTERLWRRLGFRYHRSDLPDGVEKSHKGWMITTNNMHFSFADRLRLLLTGKLKIEIRQAPNVPVDSCVNATSWRILAPRQTFNE